MSRRRHKVSPGELECRSWVKERRRAGFRAKVLSLSAVRADWRRITGEVEKGTFVLLTRRGKPFAVMVPAQWYRANNTSELHIPLGPAERAVLAEWSYQTGTTVHHLVRRAIFGTGLPNCTDDDALIDRIRRVADAASRVFESRAVAWEWMFHGVPALDWKSPVSLLKDERGERSIRDLLARIEHGVYT